MHLFLQKRHNQMKMVKNPVTETNIPAEALHFCEFSKNSGGFDGFLALSFLRTNTYANYVSTHISVVLVNGDGVCIQT